MNYYELLGVTPNASAEVIKNAYKTLAKRFHPDTYDGDRIFAEEKMKLLNEAISVLENEEKRKLYNEENNIGLYSSHSTVFSSPDLSDTFMEDIDNFLNKRNKKTNNAQKTKKQIINDDIDNAGDTVADSVAALETIEDIENISEYTQQAKSIQDALRNVEYYDEEEDDDDGVDIKRHIKKPRSQTEVKVGMWYWITVGALIMGIIILSIFISRAFSLENLRSVFFSEDGQDNVGINNIYDEWEDEYGEHNFNPTISAEIPTEPAIEDYLDLPDSNIPLPIAVEEETVSQDAPLPTQAPTAGNANNNITPTQSPTQRPTNPPRPTAAPTTQPPTAAPTEPPENTDTMVAPEETENEDINDRLEEIVEQEINSSDTDNINSEENPDLLNKLEEDKQDLVSEETDSDTETNLPER